MDEQPIPPEYKTKPTNEYYDEHGGKVTDFLIGFLSTLVFNVIIGLVLLNYDARIEVFIFLIVIELILGFAIGQSIVKRHYIIWGILAAWAIPLLVLVFVMGSCFIGFFSM
jgi:hypothetical protein